MFLIGSFALLSSLQAAPVDYTFDKKATNLYVTVYKDDSTLLSAAAHNHAIRAKNFTGSLRWDAEDPTACNIAVSFNVSDLEVDSDYSRNLAASKEPDAKIKKGFEKTISKSDRKAVRDNMLSEGQLNSSQFQKISFQSTACTADSVTGDFTVRGVTKSITMPAKIKTAESGAWKFLIKGAFPIKSTDYGFKPYKGLGGAVANKADMRINVYIRGN